MDSIQTASLSSAVLPVLLAHFASPVQAVIASELDSWLLPSANGEVPDAQE